MILGRRGRLFGDRRKSAFVRGQEADSFVGLFDQYGYPAFGASMRLLGANYTGGLVRVRAFNGSADQGTADVMPYDDGSGEQFVSLNSTITNLDATAQGRPTVPTTLGELLSSGVSNYDGFITTWYDQSGNANDASQATAVSQPQIASAGSLILENGKPTLLFEPGKKVISNQTVGTTDTRFAVAKYDNITGVAAITDNNGSNAHSMHLSAGFYRSFDVGSADPAYGSSTSNQSLHTVYVNASGSYGRVNQVQDSLNTGANGYQNGIILGGFRLSIAPNTNVRIQEFFDYPIDKTSDVLNIETNINNAFSIY